MKNYNFFGAKSPHRLGLSMSEMDPLNHIWLDFAIKLGLALHQFKKKLLLKVSLVLTKCCNAHFARWLRHLLRPVAAIKIHADYAGTADYTRISEWAQLDLQSIQHRD